MAADTTTTHTSGDDCRTASAAGGRRRIFVSSTFVDLKDERQAAFSAVMQLGHVPIGMEMFSPDDDDVWDKICAAIRACDDYLLIIGGRYGSTDRNGLGCTEKEYDQALGGNKPVIALLCRDPGELPEHKTEDDTAAWELLKKFRARVERRHVCAYWQSTADLQAKVRAALAAAGEAGADEAR